jgi:hypothetical protein
MEENINQSGKQRMGLLRSFSSIMPARLFSNTDVTENWGIQQHRLYHDMFDIIFYNFIF